MKKRYLFSFAVLAFMTAACSSDENTQELSGRNDQKIPFTATISVGDASTRSLTEATDGSAITTSWKKDEQVALIHNNVIDVMTVTAVNEETKAATIQGNISKADNGETVTVIYPASAVDTDTKAVKADLLKEQDGLLATISEKLDYRMATSTLAVSDGGSTFGAAVTLALQYAIWKLSLTDGTNAISATKFVMKDGNDNVLTTVTPASASSSLYIAMAPADNATFKFEATVGDDVYTYSKTGITFKAGKFYVSTMAMNAPEPPTPTKQDGSIAFATATPSQTWSATAADNTYTQTVTHTGDADVTYSISDNTCGAEINASTGKVTFTKAGSVKVTATVDDTDAYTYATKEVSYTLTINKAAGSISYTTGTVEKLTTNGAFTNALTKVGDGKVTYSSSDTDGTIATVNSSTGEVTIKGSGEAIITATVEDSDTYTYATKTATYTVKVSVPTQTIGGAVGYGEGGDLTPMTPAN